MLEQIVRGPLLLPQEDGRVVFHADGAGLGCGRDRTLRRGVGGAASSHSPPRSRRGGAKAPCFRR